MKLLFFDTETTGLPTKRSTSAYTQGVWPDIVSIGWIQTNKEGNVLVSEYYIIKPEDWTIPAEATAIHKITNELAVNNGYSLKYVINKFYTIARASDVIVSHNMRFDRNVINNALIWRLHRVIPCMELWNKRLFCTMVQSTKLSIILHKNKFPKLSELYYHVFGFNYNVDHLHNALNDTQVLKECFFKLWNVYDLPIDNPSINNASNQNSFPTKLVLSLEEPDETV